MSEVKVSVIIPLFNQERYVEQCLKSILSQSLRELEVICIDDGSTDGGLAVVRRIAAADGRLRVVARENRGVGVTRNEGMALATGEFVAFMDPDDFYPSTEVLARLYAAARKAGARICGGSLVVYNGEEDKYDEQRKFPNFFERTEFVDYADFQLDYGYTRYIYDRCLLVDNAVTFPNYKRYQDPPFFVKAMIAAGRFLTIPDYVYTYRWSRRFSKWDVERALHLASALRDNLVLAREHCLWKLFDSTLMRVKVDFKAVFVENPSDALRAVLAEIMELAVAVSADRFAGCGGKSPMVSVVIPIYNTEAYLRQCLDSLAKQTLAEMEFICVNDGSTDASLRIMREFSARDPRFKVIDKPNGGYGQSVNCGLAAAKGRYVGIVEPDDFVAPEMYRELVDCAETNKVDFVKSGIVFYWKDRPAKRKSICEDKSIVGRVIDPRADSAIFTAIMNNVTGIYLRSLIDASGIRLNETPGAAYQDNGFYLQVHYAARKVFLLDKEFYFYRQDNENSSINSREKAFAIFEEYRLNDAILKNSPGKRKAFLGHYLYKKFKSYKFHFDRIDPKDRLEFLEKMAAEFKRHDAAHEIDWSVMSEGHRGILRSLLDDYRIYYERRKDAIATFGNHKSVAALKKETSARPPTIRGTAKPWDAAFKVFEKKNLAGMDADARGAFVYTKFKAYKAALREIAAKNVIPFLERFRREFLAHRDAGQIPWDKMTPGHVGVLKSLLEGVYPYAVRVLVSRLEEGKSQAGPEDHAAFLRLRDKLAKTEKTAKEHQAARLRHWRELKRLKASRSYKIGRFLTWPVRMVKRKILGV